MQGAALVLALVVAGAAAVLLLLERWTPYTRTPITPGLRYRVRGVEHQVDPAARIEGTPYLLRPEVLADLADLVQATDEVLNQLEIPYVVSHGTLLGTVRNQGVMPFDDDGDAYVLDQEAFAARFAEVERAFADRGCHLWKQAGATYYKVSKTGSRWNYPYMDLYEYWDKFGDEDNLYPLGRLPFEDFEVNVPHRYLHCLDIFYRKRPDDDPLKVIKAPFLGRYINNLAGNMLHALGIQRVTVVTKRLEAILGLNEGNQT